MLNPDQFVWLRWQEWRISTGTAKHGTSGDRLEHSWNKTLSFRGVFQCLPELKAIESSAFLERAMGIEPTSEAWEASILPLYDARSGTNVAKPIHACKHGSHGPETNRVFQASCIRQATYADFFAH
jgi:hypothetical protein